MKRTIVYTMIMMLLSMIVLGQKGQQVPFDEIQKIANRNAQALWGDVYPAEPIPYFGFDDEIVAWQFNFSIGKEFPEKKILKEQCISAKFKGDAYNQWGNGQFGRILMSARTDMPVIIEHANMLSFEYAEAGRIRKLMQKANLNTDVQPAKGYYFGLFNVWYEYSAKGEKQYICPAPGKGVISETDFLARKTKTENTFKSSDYTIEWEKYKAGFVHPTKGDTYVPYYEYMPFIDWSYGCSPTAAMMLIAYYDYRSVVASSKFPLMVVNTFDRWDGIVGEQDYYVCGTHRQLAVQMDTDTIYEGITYVWNVDEGMEAVTNGSCGYNFDIVNRYDLPWTYLKNEIDENRPVLNHSYNIHHTFCAVGYNGSANEIIVHDTWGYGLSWVDKTHADILTKVQPGGSKGHHIQILEPVGDRRYNSDGQGEDYYADNYAEITWESDCLNTGTVELYYSTTGGHSWDEITETENDHLYNWHIPAGINSTECRIMIYLKIDDEYAGADCSPQNFKIHADSPTPTMVSEHRYSTDSLPRYYYFQHTEPSWAVIGAKSDLDYCNWEIQLYNNTNFNQNPAFSSTYDGITNYMVVDGNHYPSSLRGIKIKPLDDHRPVQLEYEGGNENLVFGSNGPYAWNANEIVEMKEIHLTPRRYYFELETTSGWPDLGMALYGSTDGIYLKPQSFNIGYSNYASGAGLESFTVNITEEDDYGLCVFSNRHEDGNYKIKILTSWIWTGAVSSNWHEPGNWNTNLVPDNLSNVVITGDGHDPVISESFAMCADLNILNTGRLRLNGNNLMVTGDLHLHGWLLILNPDNRIDCTGDFVAEQYSYIEMTAGSGINAFGNWTFGENSNILLNSGFVDFRGSFNSMIYCLSETSRFYDLKISKMSGATVRYDNHIGIQPLRVKNEFLINFGGTFIQSAMHTVIMDGTFNCVAGGNYYFQDGTVRFERPGAGGFSMSSNAGSYFNDIVVSVGDWLGLAGDIEIRGDLLIEEGTFKTNGHDISIKGNWTNNATFNHGNARVTFNGTGIQEITGTNFWELELNKTVGELRVHESTVSVQHYDWTQGTVRVNGGWFQLNDLEDPGIYGTVIVTSGKLDLHQEPDEYIDLNGNLQITGGEMNIYGGNGDSYWPFSANASFTMSDGTLDFKSNGLRIHNSATYTLTENITGGIIKLNGNLTVARTDFNPAGGTINFYGYTEDATVSVATGSNLFNLELNKSSKGPKALAKTLTASGTLDLNGDFILTGGNFEAPTKMYIGGLFVNNQTAAHFDELTSEIILDGPVDQGFNQEETFYKLTINKPSDGTVAVSNDVVLTITNKLLVDRGNLIFNPGGSLLLGGYFEADNLGNVFFNGVAGNEISVTSASKSWYSFDISGGGFISANNTVFSGMGGDGIFVHSGAYVDADNAFTECSFRDGYPGGALIRWENGADVVIHHAVFPTNTTGSAYNVNKPNNFGHLYFDEATGPFAGSAFENDPFSRVDWEYVAPFTLPFTEKWNSNSFATQKWVPEGGNWLISEAWGNPAPSADFHFHPRIYNYSVPLRSHLLDGTDATGIHVKYDIRYVKYSAATLEQFKVQVVLQNGDFITLATYNNTGGTFGFITEEMDVSDFADGEIFYLRFTAFGVDSWSIDGWFIDNIEVTGIPVEPAKLTGYVLNNVTSQPIENALIALDGTSYSALSQSNGQYTINNIVPATYNVTVTSGGYEPATLEGIAILPGETVSENFLLTPIPPVYCTEDLYLYGCTSGDGLNYFELNTIRNPSSGCSSNGYGDFTTQIANIARGYLHDVLLSSESNNQYVSLWIDLNDNFEFETGEQLLQNFILIDSGVIYSTHISIPSNTATGAHRLRVRTNNVGLCNDACATYEYGEAEDYSVFITNDILSGTLMTTLMDQSTGAPVTGATVLLNGTDWYGITEEEGICLIDNIAPGTYDILITADGFHAVNHESFPIAGNQMNFLTEPMIPNLSANITLPEILIHNDESECFAATDTMIVAGNGTHFTIEPGGAAELVAGEVVHLLPGTLVEEGGYLLVRITNSGDYCSIPKSFVAGVVDPLPTENTNMALCQKLSFFNIYPNPSTGRFTLELAGSITPDDVIVEVSNLMGVQIFKNEFPGAMNHIIDLENVAPGIYMIKVMRGNELGSKKLIKK